MNIIICDKTDHWNNFKNYGNIVEWNMSLQVD